MNPPIIRYTVTTDATPAVPVPVDLMHAMRTWLQWLRASMIEARDEKGDDLTSVVGAIAEIDRIDALWLTIMQTAMLIYFRRIAPAPEPLTPDGAPADNGEGAPGGEIGPPINEKGC